MLLTYFSTALWLTFNANDRRRTQVIRGAAARLPLVAATVRDRLVRRGLIRAPMGPPRQARSLASSEVSEPGHQVEPGVSAMDTPYLCRPW